MSLVFNSSVTAILVVGTTIYAGGNFTNAAGNSAADYIARWSGGSWHALGSGPGSGGAAVALRAPAVSTRGIRCSHEDSTTRADRRRFVFS